MRRLKEIIRSQTSECQQVSKKWRGEIQVISFCVACLPRVAHQMFLILIIIRLSLGILYNPFVSCIMF